MIDTKERAKKAADARWGDKRDRLAEWRTLPLDEALNRYAALRNDMAEISNILNNRMPASHSGDKPEYKCGECGRLHSRICYTESSKDPSTDLFVSLFLCSEVCFNVYMTKKRGGVVAK